MSTGSLIFMTICWSAVLGLAGWSLWRVVRTPPRSTEDRGATS